MHYWYHHYLCSHCLDLIVGHHGEASNKFDPEDMGITLSWRLGIAVLNVRNIHS